MPGMQGLGGLGGGEAQPGATQPWTATPMLGGGGLPGMGLLSGLFGQKSSSGQGQQGSPTLSSLGLPDPLGQLLGKLGLPVPPLIPPGLQGLFPQQQPAAEQPAAPTTPPSTQPAPDAAAAMPAPTPAPTQPPTPGIRPQDLLRLAGGYVGAPSMGAGQQNMLRTLSSPFGWR